MFGFFISQNIGCDGTLRGRIKYRLIDTDPLATGNSALCMIIPHSSSFPNRLVVNVPSAKSLDVGKKGESNH